MRMDDRLEGNTVIISLSGKIMGGDDATLFHGKMHEYLNLAKKNFIIDLQKVQWSNSLGLGMLIAGLAAVERAEGRMLLANITNVKTLLAITRLLRVFECFDSLEDARKALAKPAP